MAWGEDHASQDVLASGLVAVPDKPMGSESPVISYQHGTTFKDAQAPSNAIAPDEAPIVMASAGFIVVAADYAGYGASKSSQHPYLLSGPTAAAVIDLIIDRAKKASPVLAALVSPGLLSHLGSTVRNEVRRAMFKQLVPDDADVSFQSTFLDNYLADDGNAIERMSNVHDWKPEAPLRVFHGRDDQTVPYAASVRALQAMQSRTAATVSLTDCAALPPDHLPCVPPYFALMLDYVRSLARKL